MFRLTISDPNSPPASNIIVQASTNLVSPIIWLNIHTGVPPFTPFTFIDPDSSNYPYRFYRAVLWP